MNKRAREPCTPQTRNFTPQRRKLMPPPLLPKLTDDSPPWGNEGISVFGGKSQSQLLPQLLANAPKKEKLSPRETNREKRINLFKWYDSNSKNQNPNEAMYILRANNSDDILYFDICPDNAIELETFKPNSIEELALLVDMILDCLKYQWPLIPDEKFLGKFSFVLLDNQVFITQKNQVFYSPMSLQDRDCGCMKILDRIIRLVKNMYYVLVPDDLKWVSHLAENFLGVYEYQIEDDEEYDYWSAKMWWYIFPTMSTQDFKLFSSRSDVIPVPEQDIQYMRSYVEIHDDHYPNGDDYLDFDGEDDDEENLDPYKVAETWKSFKHYINTKVAEKNTDENTDENYSAFSSFMPNGIEIAERQSEFPNHFLVRFFEILQELFVVLSPKIDSEYKRKILFTLIEDFCM